MIYSSSASDFFLPLSNLADFTAAQPLLDRRLEALEKAWACGALLMLEHAFELNPCAVAVTASSDFEGGLDVLVLVRSNSGVEAYSNDVALALINRDTEIESGESSAKLVSALRSMQRPELISDRRSMQRPELVDAFSELGFDAIDQAETALREAMQFFVWRAPGLFHSKVASFPILCGTAVDIGRSVGLNESASMIECSRLDQRDQDQDIPRAASRRI